MKSGRLGQGTGVYGVQERTGPEMKTTRRLPLCKGERGRPFEVKWEIQR